jgi:hypothetical protein
MLTGCNPYSKQSTLQISPLDESLAKPCKSISVPEANYDEWEKWVIDEVLPAYAGCAIDKNKIVQEWNKLVEKSKTVK